MATSLSIITINFNNREGLRRTIASILLQTWQEFEWIIIDGGSQDGSKELIEAHQSRLSYWCSEPDKGIFNAMNKGAGKAIGDYLLFLNSGDVLYDNQVLESVHKKGLQSDIVSGQIVRMDNDQLLRSYENDILMQLFNKTINHQATFIRRTLFDEMTYDESLRIVADWKFWLEAIIIRSCSFEVWELRIAKQDMTGISLDEKNQALHLAERRQVLKELFPTRIIGTLQAYDALRNQPAVRNLAYLKDRHPGWFSLLKKLISLITILLTKISKS